MKVIETSVRVRYCDTDQMGFVHHSNYPKYCEVARLDALEKIGINYKNIEDKGVEMPVLSMNFDFLKPAFYNDVLNIVTTIHCLSGLKLKFGYEIFNQDFKLINKAETVLTFINKITKKPCKPPVELQKKLIF